MVRNEQGGVLSKMFIIPAGVVVIITVFLAGYFVGKREAGTTASADRPPALPEVVSQYLPNKEDFTFYKSLTEKGEKTVSVDLKPKPRSDEPAPTKKEGEPATAGEAVKKPAAEKPAAGRTDPAPRPAQTKTPAPAAKKEPAAPAASSKVRYTVQVGAYPEKAMAEEEVRNMKRRGYAAFLVATNIPDKGIWYRVRIGSFANKDAAEKLANDLKAKEGTASFVTAE